MTKLLAFVLLAAALPAQAAMKPLTFQKDLLPREARAWEYDKAMSVNSNNEVSFRLEGEPKIVSSSIEQDGVITNTSSSKKTIYVVGDKDVLKLDLETSDQIKLRDSKKSTPPMFAIEIPPKTEVKIIGQLPLDRYIYTGSPEAKLNWVFQFWRTPRPHGQRDFKLPTTSEAKLPPFKIEFQKFSATDQSKLTASLRNISTEPQVFCRNSQVNFYWNLKAVDGSEIQDVERLNVEYENRPMSASDCSVISPEEALELETANIKKEGSTYRFETPHATWRSLKPGQFNVWFQALNSAVSGDPKVVEAARAKKSAAKPSKAIETTEITQAVSIP